MRSEFLGDERTGMSCLIRVFDGREFSMAVEAAWSRRQKFPEISIEARTSLLRLMVLAVTVDITKHFSSLLENKMRTPSRSTPSLLWVPAPLAATPPAKETSAAKEASIARADARRAVSDDVCCVVCGGRAQHRCAPCASPVHSPAMECSVALPTDETTFTCKPCYSKTPTPGESESRKAPSCATAPRADTAAAAKSQRRAPRHAVQPMQKRTATTVTTSGKAKTGTRKRKRDDVEDVDPEIGIGFADVGSVQESVAYPPRQGRSKRAKRANPLYSAYVK